MASVSTEGKRTGRSGSYERVESTGTDGGSGGSGRLGDVGVDGFAVGGGAGRPHVVGMDRDERCDSVAAFDDNASETASPVLSSFPSRVLAWMDENFLPLMLIAATLIGALVPWPGVWLDTPRVDLGPDVGELGVVSSVAVFCIFFIQGMSLKTDEVVEAVGQRGAFAYGFLVILGLTSFAGLLVLHVQLEPRALITGLAIFTCMPTTVSSGVVLVKQAKGMWTLALLLTVVTNVLGIFTVPWSMQLVLHAGDGAVRLNPVPLLLKLILTILLPVLLGKVAKDYVSFVSAVALAYKPQLSKATTCLLALIPLMKVSTASESLRSISAASFVAIIALGLVLHLVFLAVNVAGVITFGFPLGVRKCLVIMCSQKTLPVCLSVISFLPPSFGEHGLMAIPCIIGHIVQIVVDAYLAQVWSHRTIDAGHKIWDWAGLSALEAEGRSLVYHDSETGDA